MASSDNLMAMDNHSWMFRNPCLDTWLPETFSRETETFTKAIHKSFDTQDFDNMNFSTEFISPWLNTTSDSTQVSIQTSTHTPTGSCGSEVNVRDDLIPLLGELKRPVNNGVLIGGSVKRGNGGGGGGGGGKMKKRRTRASKGATTTFINADAANFRQLVQEITGVKFGGGNGLFSGGGGGGGQLLKPQPHRVANSLQLIGGGGLVTLDTSGYLVDPAQQNNQDKVVFNHQVGGGGGGAPSSAVVGNGGSGFEFDSFCSFPTLESWKAI